MKQNHPDRFDQELLNRLSGAASTEVHGRTHKHFESLAASLRQRQADLAAPEPGGRNLFLVVGSKLWRELIWPSRRIWAGLACAWVMIIVLNVATSEPSSRVAGKPEPRSREEMQALIEQRRMLAQLIEPLSEPIQKRKVGPPGPRSEQALRTSMS